MPASTPGVAALVIDPEFAIAPGKDPAFVGPPPAFGGVFARFVALVIDNLVVNLIAGAIGPTLARTLNLDMTAGFFSVSVLIGATYNAAMISSETRATLGKLALGLKVTGLHGERISATKAFVREFSKYLSGLIGGLGYLLAIFTERKQTLHDMIAGTIVLKAR